MPPAGCLHVVAAAVTATDGRVLIAQRPPGKHLAGGWEFPGGKLEPGESPTAGLARELAEELGIAIQAPRPLLRVRHTYAHGDVLIDMWVVTRYHGTPRGLDGQRLRWLTAEELDGADLLPADRPIVRALRLPERLAAADTPEYEVAADLPRPGGGSGSKLHGVYCSGAVEAALAAARGADFVVLTHVVSSAPLAELCAAVAIPVFACDMTLEAAWSAGATGVHSIGP